MEREKRFYQNHVANLPKVPLGTPLERGKVYHLVIHHDEWCRIYDESACNCAPIVEWHLEPSRH
jgi:hypothetical protein